MAARRVLSALALFVCIGALFLAIGSIAESASPVANVFDAGRLTRGRAAPDTIERTITVPPWVTPPYTMRVQNGEPSGANRMVLAWIWINNQRVLAPSDLRLDRDPRFDEQYDRTTFAASDDEDEVEQALIRQGRPPSDGIVLRTVSLQPMSKVRVRLSGRPDRYLRVLITGTNADRTAPYLSVVEPAGLVEATVVPIRLRYLDAVGAGEPAASGVLRTTVHIMVDATDRTASFVTTNTDASASLSLGEGMHVVQAQVSDLVGNIATVSHTFFVRRPPPCAYSVLPSTVAASADASAGRIGVSTESRCIWAASSGASWIAIDDVADGYRGQVMADGPSGYWRLGETASETARDISGNHLDGSLVGSVTQGIAGAISGDAAAKFQGGWMQFAAGVPLLGGAFSLEAWFMGPGGGVIAFGSGWTLTVEAGQVRFRAEINEVERFNVGSQRVVDEGGWHHVVAVYAPAAQTVSLFVDGVFDASGPTSPDPLRGTTSFTVGPIFAGLDDVAVYRSALTLSQAAAHFGRRAASSGGSGSVGYTVAPNPSFESRTGVLTVAGSAVTIQQQGQPADVSQGQPIQRPGLHYSVAAGLQHVLALKDDGRVWSWGANASGQLGDGTTLKRSLPVPVPAPAGVVTIAAGDAHSLALRSDGTVWAWGNNGFGQLGDGTVEFRVAALQVNGLTDVVAIAAGSWHSVALKADGTVWTWGRNQVGQLGDGTTNSRGVPARVTSVPARVAAIAAFGARTRVVDALGGMWEWGAGSLASPPALVPVDAVTASTSGNATVAVSTDGRVWTWGANESSQLGDGTIVSRSSPIQIADAGFVWHTGTPILTAGGTFSVEWTALGASATPGAIIHYTLNGASPTEADPIMPTAPAGLAITQTLTLKARAWAAGKPPSGVASETFTLKVPAVTINPGGGTHTSTQMVSLSTTGAGATIRYTLDGSEPTNTSPPYSSPLAISTDTVLKAAAFKSGWTPSATSSAIYAFNLGTLAPPLISPSPGTYPSGQTVTLSADPQATIRYTTDGSIPNAASTMYSGPLALTGAFTVKAMAFRAGWLPSSVVSAAFTVESRPASCTYRVNPGGIGAAAEGMSGELVVTVNDESCTWDALGDAPWLSLSASGSSSAYAQTVLADHPIGYWRLVEPAGAITVADASGHMRTATVSGAVTFGSAGALVDRSTAASFAGTTGRIVVPHDAGLDLSAWTWEAWVNVAAISSGSRRILGKGGSDEVFSVWILPGSSRATVYYRVAGRPREAVTLTGTIVGAGWVHLAFASNPTTWRAFVNGSQDQSGATGGALATTTGAIVFGGDDAAQAGYDGKLAEVALYSSALTAEQIANHAAQRGVMVRGSGRVVYAVAPNLTAAARTAAITIGETRLPVAQASQGGIAIAGATSSTSSTGWFNHDVTVSFACVGAGVTSCSQPVTLSKDGEQDVRGEAVTALGRTETTVRVRIDKTPPYLSVSYPLLGQLVVPGPVTLRGTSIDLTSGLSAVTCAGQPADVKGAEFTCALSIPAGLSTVTLRAFDVASNMRETIVSIATEDAVASPPTTMRITPQNVTIAAGETRRFSVIDEDGHIPAHATWTIDNAGIATLSTTPDVTLTAVSAGEITLTASWRGLTATTHVTVVGTAAAVGTTLWSAAPVRGSVERIIQGAVTLDNQRRVYTLEHSEGTPQDLIRAFDADGAELWATNVPGRVMQISGDPFGGVVALYGGTITGFTPGGGGFAVGTGAGPGFAVGEDGSVYYVRNDLLMSGSGSLSLAHPSGGLIDAGVPTVLEDGRVAVPLHVGATASTSEKLQLAVTRPEGGVDLHTVWDALSQTSPDVVTPYKAVSTGHGDILVAWSAFHTFLGASNSNLASAYVRVVHANGEPGAFVAEAGGLWGLPGRYPFGDFVVTEDRVISTAYRLFDAENEAVVTQFTLNGSIIGQDTWHFPEAQVPEFPTFLAVAGGSFIASYSNGTMGGPDEAFSRMVLAKAQYQGKGTWLGALNGSLKATAGPVVGEPNSVWAQSQGSGQAANAAVRPGVGIFLKGQPVFLGYLHASIRIVPRRIDFWMRKRPDFVGPNAKRFPDTGLPPPVDSFQNFFGTLGAESSIGSCGGLLESDLNRERDVSSLTLDLEPLPYSSFREDALIEQLLNLDSLYRDDLPYRCFPDPGTNEHNSNSYVSGLLKAAQLPSPSFVLKQLSSYPGWLKPVPVDKFK